LYTSIDSDLGRLYGISFNSNVGSEYFTRFVKYGSMLTTALYHDYDTNKSGTISQGVDDPTDFSESYDIGESGRYLKTSTLFKDLSSIDHSEWQIPITLGDTRSYNSYYSQNRTSIINSSINTKRVFANSIYLSVKGGMIEFKNIKTDETGNSSSGTRTCLLLDELSFDIDRYSGDIDTHKKVINLYDLIRSRVIRSIESNQTMSTARKLNEQKTGQNNKNTKKKKKYDI
jgi:hypothetical protein